MKTPSPKKSGVPPANSTGSSILRDTIPLLPYQRRWIDDDAKLKIAGKARQTGYSFASSLRAVLKCLDRRTTWVFLSAGERQARLLMEKVSTHIKAIGMIPEIRESTFMEATQTKQLEARFPNGSVIYGLPANPDTARGYSGNVTLDEFAFHDDAAKIYQALLPSITRGYGLEIISTPNGKQGKYYELAKNAGLIDGEAGDPHSSWSAHRVDVYRAAAEGLADTVPDPDMEFPERLLMQVQEAFIERGIKASKRMLRFVASLRAGVDEEDSWLQEFCCQFVSTAENFIPPELFSACVSGDSIIDGLLDATARLPGENFLGIDIGRQHDRSVLWLDNVRMLTPAPDVPAKRVALTRLVKTLHKTPFHEQMAVARELLLAKFPSGAPLIRRCSIDATGMGAPLAEGLQREFGEGRVDAVVFTNLVKEDLAYRIKRQMEAGECLLPENPQIRRAFSAIKKVVLPSQQIRFDAERTEAGHSDEFWAKALAAHAAEAGVPAACGGRDEERTATGRRRSFWDAEPKVVDEEVHAGMLDRARRGRFGLRTFLR